MCGTPVRIASRDALPKLKRGTWPLSPLSPLLPLYLCPPLVKVFPIRLIRSFSVIFTSPGEGNVPPCMGVATVESVPLLRRYYFFRTKSTAA